MSRDLLLPDATEDAAERSAAVRAVRVARERLRHAAAAGEAALVDDAVDGLVGAAIAAGFSGVTACSVAAAALEEGLRARRSSSGRPLRRIAPWEGALEARIRARYRERAGELTPGAHIR